VLKNRYGYPAGRRKRSTGRSTDRVALWEGWKSLERKVVVSGFIELARIRIVGMVMVACAIGFVLAGGGATPLERLFWTLLGTGLLTAGACALNGALERRQDGLMERTRHRPLPAGSLQPAEASVFGILLAVAGWVVLLWKVNLLAGSLGLLSALLYVLVYTPLKSRSAMNTPVGAVPGAIPALIGWAGGAGRIETGAWVLFAMLFLWQHVHFWTIAWVFRDDYRRAGFRMLPGAENGGKNAFRLSVFAAAALLPVSLLLSALGLAGPAYCFGALFFGGAILATGIALSRSQSNRSARAVMIACACYLPLLLGMILLDLYWILPGGGGPRGL